MTKTEVIQMMKNSIRSLKSELGWCSNEIAIKINERIDAYEDAISLIEQIESELPRWVQEALNSNNGTYKP
jgi:hypothetical protein